MRRFRHTNRKRRVDFFFSFWTFTRIKSKTLFSIARIFISVFANIVIDSPETNTRQLPTMKCTDSHNDSCRLRRTSMWWSVKNYDPVLTLDQRLYTRYSVYGFDHIYTYGIYMYVYVVRTVEHMIYNIIFAVFRRKFALFIFASVLSQYRCV